MIESTRLQGIGMTSRRTRERLVARLRKAGIVDEQVLERLRDVPRHLFVDEALAHRAYEDTALPIGHGQTISQPFVVALMTQTLLARSPQRVLEVGTGCGYQSAVLAPLVPRLYSVERIEALAQRARDRLRQLSLSQVSLRCGDGYRGLPGAEPFDGIIVTAAPAQLPPALLAQLAPGGRLVVPEGADGVQELAVYDKDTNGSVARQVIDYVRFVPLLPGVTAR
ncbi:MAG: protein-L-isoaspartate(D-aspartate) O-methyltransferase [Pseudomonadota bacterium]